MVTITTLRSVPPFAVGHVRDLRVRWALEEAGQRYDVHLIALDPAERPPAYRHRQPFAQVPVLDDGDLSLFESGAILLHLGARFPALLPAQQADRELATMWLFAALNTVEPPILALVGAVFFAAGQAWVCEARPMLEQNVLQRLRDVDGWLEERDYLAGDFSIADIPLTTMLRICANLHLPERFARLDAYLARCTARPAFQKALADQVALYAHPPREVGEPS